MPALLINLKIDAQEKFEFFKVTLGDIAGLFEECHIKLRGAYAQECVNYAQDQLGDGIHLYQTLQESDWVAATLEMLRQVESRSVFVYFEDHRLVASRQRMEQILAAFDQSNLDYLCYSFWKASQLDVKNLLPLGAVEHELFCEFCLSQSNVNLVGKISPNYYTFSLVSLVSVEYFERILAFENRQIKIFHKIIIAILIRSFPYPRYRRLIQKINAALARLNAILCIYDPASPFNPEKAWYESQFNNRSWKFGILRQELFANFDDDNGAYEESLIKKGRYPFDAHKCTISSVGNCNSAVRQMALKDGERFDCTYYSHNGRIRRAPIVQINVIRGSIAVHYRDACFPLSSGDAKLFYSNLGPVIHCIEYADLEIKVFDEAFN